MLRSAAIPLAAILGAGASSGYLLPGPPTARANAPGGDDGLLAPGPVPTRAQQVAKLRGGSRDEPFDVLIIGGGATGTGCALDAATRCGGQEARAAAGWESERCARERLAAAGASAARGACSAATTLQDRCAGLQGSGAAPAHTLFWPCARRGLRTALVERGDFGCGTSSKSTKLVHGGVRYLEVSARHRGGGGRGAGRR